MQRLDAEDRLVGIGLVFLTLAGALIHLSLGLAVLGAACVLVGLALARRSE